MRHYVDTQTIRTLYFSLFHSHMTYGCLTWGLTNKNELNRVSKLQKRAIRLMSFSTFYDHTSALFSQFEVLKIKDVITLKLGLLMHDWYNHKLPKPVHQLYINKITVLNKRVKNGPKLILPYRRTKSYGTKAIQFQGASLYNQLCDVNIKFNTSKSTFKKEIKTLLMAKYA